MGESPHETEIHDFAFLDLVETAQGVIERLTFFSACSKETCYRWF